MQTNLLRELPSILDGKRATSIEQLQSFDEVQSHFADLAFFVMFVFILIAWYLNQNATGKIEAAQRQAEFATKRFEDVQSTEKGQLYSKLEENLIDLQRQKLLRALDAIEEQERTRLGLSYFGDIQNNSGDARLQNILENGKLSQRADGVAFATGCKLAQEHFATDGTIQQLQSTWVHQALEASQLLVSNDVTTAYRNPNFITPDNRKWLEQEEVPRRVKSIAESIKALHKNACDLLLSYFENHMDEINMPQVPEVKRFLEKFRESLESSSGVSDDDLSRLASIIKNYAYSIFETSGAPLLR